ncbi:MAG: hypothetical protein U0527_07560 [Candidatus Eisenbacteria bacterium]
MSEMTKEAVLDWVRKASMVEIAAPGRGHRDRVRRTAPRLSWR